MPRTVLDRLIELYPTAKRQTLRRMAADRRVLVNGKPIVRLNALLADGEAVTVVGRPAGDAQRPARGEPSRDEPPTRGRRGRGLSATGGGQGGGGGARPGGWRVVFEDADLLVVDKPPGLLTSTVPREPRPTLLAAVREYAAATDPRARVGLIHRLDRDASGLLVFSKTDAAYHSLKTQFFHHEVERVYSAVVRGAPDPPAGRIESHLVERADGVVYSTRQVGKGQRAVTDYKVVRSGRKASLLAVSLRTGRKHQIRVHLSERGWQILGDPVYGPQHAPAKGAGGKKAPPPPPRARLMLTATRLALTHPRTGERVTFELPVPDEFERALGAASASGAATAGGAPEHPTDKR